MIKDRPLNDDNRATFIRFEKNKDALETEKETQLPGQVYAITNTVLENEKNMNVSGIKTVSFGKSFAM